MWLFIFYLLIRPPEPLGLEDPKLIASLLERSDTPPDLASHLAAHAVGSPHLSGELRGVAVRERASGIHENDSWASERAYRRSVARGWIDPSCQPLGAPGAWSTRGTHGLMAAYHLHLVPELGPCAAPSALDRPEVSALAAARKMREVGGTCWTRIRAWVGESRWDKMRFHRKLAKGKRHCRERRAFKSK